MSDRKKLVFANEAKKLVFANEAKKLVFDITQIPITVGIGFMKIGLTFIIG